MEVLSGGSIPINFSTAHFAFRESSSKLDFFALDRINEFTLLSLIKKVHYLCITVKMKHSNDSTEEINRILSKCQ